MVRAAHGVLIATMVLTLAGGGAVRTDARAQEVLTVTSQYGPGRPQTVFWEDVRDAVNAALPGAYTFRIVTNGALGGEKEEAEAIRLGAISGALSTVANLTTWVPEGAVLDLPFVFSGPDHIKRVLDGPLGDELKRAYRAEGFMVPAFIVFGDRHILSDAPVTEPAQLEGVTLRSLQSDLHLNFWRALGAKPVALPITEAYGALANGVVGAMDMTKSGYDALKLYEVAPVLSETAHMTAIGVVYFAAPFWDGLSDEHRGVFVDAAEAAAAAFNANAAAEQEAALARATEQGGTRISVDQAPWRDATGAFVDAYVAADGGPTADALATIRAAQDQ